MSETQIPAEVPPYAALAVIGDPEIAILVAQLVLGQEIRSAVVEDFPVEEIRMHVRFRVDDVIALGFRLDFGRF
jgi:hypothetical protein